MEIMPNWTVMALQLIPFFVTILALYKIILAPMLDYLEERRKAIESGTKGVDTLNAQLEARTAEYDLKLRAARSKGSEIRASKRADAKASYDDRISEARQDAEKQVNLALTEIQAGALEARTELEKTSQTLAAEIAAQVLGRPLAEG
jgi:F-type H+-transporting ATPase subunit b